MEVAPKEMKQTLLKQGFIRAHQGFYVNPAHIKAIEHEIVRINPVTASFVPAAILLFAVIQTEFVDDYVSTRCNRAFAATL